jgi:hypothetical protein
LKLGGWGGASSPQSPEIGPKGAAVGRLWPMLLVAAVSVLALIFLDLLDLINRPKAG